MKWDKKLEEYILKLREDGYTYDRIAKEIESTPTAVKHKVRRIKQSQNDDRYKHTKEKFSQFRNCLCNFNLPIKPRILETHCGFGGMTEHYANIGEVESYDIKKERASFVNNRFDNSIGIHADSEIEIYRLVANKRKYDIIDIDPYGLPSRYFPHVFSLINDGILFLTFPVMGVAQINKITIRHYQAFWNIELSDKPAYLNKIKNKLEDFAFQHKRSVNFLDTIKIGRIYRIAMRVKRKSLCDIVGLIVKKQKQLP